VPDREHLRAELEAMHARVAALERQEEAAREAAGSPNGTRSVADPDTGSLLAVLEEDALAFERHVLRHEHFSAAVRARLRSVARSVQRRLQAAAAKVRDARAAAAKAAAAAAAAESRADALSAQLAAAGVQLDSAAVEAAAEAAAAARTAQLRTLSNELAAAQAEVLVLTQRLAAQEVELRQAQRTATAAAAPALAASTPRARARGRLSPEESTMMHRELASATVASPPRSAASRTATPEFMTPAQVLRRAEATDTVVTRSVDVTASMQIRDTSPQHSQEPRGFSAPPPGSTAPRRSMTPEGSSSPSALLSHIVSSLDGRRATTSCPPTASGPDDTTDTHPSMPQHLSSAGPTSLLDMSHDAHKATLTFPTTSEASTDIPAFPSSNSTVQSHWEGGFNLLGSGARQPLSTAGGRKTIAIPAIRTERSLSLSHGMRAASFDGVELTLHRPSLHAPHGGSRGSGASTQGDVALDLRTTTPPATTEAWPALGALEINGVNSDRAATKPDLIDRVSSAAPMDIGQLSLGGSKPGSDIPAATPLRHSLFASSNIPAPAVPVVGAAAQADVTEGGLTRLSELTAGEQRASTIRSEPGAILSRLLPATARATDPGETLCLATSSMAMPQILPGTQAADPVRGPAMPAANSNSNPAGPGWEEDDWEGAAPVQGISQPTVSTPAAEERHSPTAAVRGLLSEAEGLEDERLREGLALAQAVLRRQAQNLPEPSSQTLVSTAQEATGPPQSTPFSAALPDLSRGITVHRGSPDPLHAFAAAGDLGVLPDTRTPSSRSTPSPAVPEASLGHAVTSATTSTSELARRLAAMRSGF
jgi:hypothetical protein